MSEKKNIDRLFQEKFKDFEVSPPEFVWENLQSRLEEKKKRRVIPLWFKLSGVAAILVVGMFIVGPYIMGDTNINSPVVIDVKETNPDGTPRITPTENPVRQSQSINESAVAVEGSQNDNAVNIPADGNDGVPRQSTSVSGTDKRQYQDEAVASSGNTQKQTSRQQYRNRKKISVKNTIAEEGAVAQNDSRGNNKTNTNGSRNTGGNTYGNNTGTGNSQQEELNKQNSIQETVNPVNPEQGVAVNAYERNNPNTSGNNTSSNNGNDNVKNNVIIPQDITTVEGIAQSEVAVDSAVIETPENELEKLLRQKLNGEEEEENAIAENSDKNKWNIKPQMAPLFFNTASSGSPIDANLASNGKDFDNDLSYGVGVDYAITDRISIRSGINTVNMKYSTNDIEFYASFDASPSSAVLAPGGQNANFVISPAGSTEATDGFRSEALTGSLVQKIGFVEVPLEMSYKLVNKKFGIDLIGGVSTLFLSDNNVSAVTDQGLRSNMGEANNINSVSFSTNVGVGFKYRIFDSLEASFEPMFKYQLNTFSNNAGNFKPYFIGLYSGISFSF